MVLGPKLSPDVFETCEGFLGSSVNVQDIFIIDM
jgi:hypothetical protein